MIDHWCLQPRAVCSHTFSGIIWHCATEINSIQLHDSFVMVPLENISLNLHYIHKSGFKPNWKHVFSFMRNSSVYFLWWVIHLQSSIVKKVIWSSSLQSIDPETLKWNMLKRGLSLHWHYNKYSLVSYFFLIYLWKKLCTLAFLLFIPDSRIIIIKSHFIQYSYRNHASIQIMPKFFYNSPLIFDLLMMMMIEYGVAE